MSALKLLLITLITAFVLPECLYAEPDDCFLPRETGPCEAATDRFFYNCETGRCEKFTYGGCEGNGNNFETMEQCFNACQLCRMPKYVGPCEGHFQRYYYDIQERKCQQFMYGGCQSNRNNFLSMNECFKKCAGTKPCNGLP